MEVEVEVEERLRTEPAAGSRGPLAAALARTGTAPHGLARGAPLDDVSDDDNDDDDDDADEDHDEVLAKENYGFDRGINTRGSHLGLGTTNESGSKQHFHHSQHPQHPRRFQVIKVNKRNRRQQRTILVSAQGMRNEQGKGWFHSARDVYSVWRDPQCPSLVYAAVVKRYALGVESPHAARRMVETARLWGITGSKMSNGYEEQDDSSSAHYGCEYHAVEKEMSRLRDARARLGHWQAKLRRLKREMELELATSAGDHRSPL